MAENSAIQWTHHTFNPWRGCTKVSAGCANCYAEASSKRNPRVLGVWGPEGKRVVAAEGYWQEPLKWDRAAEQAGVRHRVFCGSFADVFEEWVSNNGNSKPMHSVRWHALFHAEGGGWIEKPPGFSSSWVPVSIDDVRARLFKLIAATPHLDWLLLTKRAGNITTALSRALNLMTQDQEAIVRTAWAERVWLGVSVEDQAAAEQRVPLLLQAPAAVRFLSCEPLLGPVDLSRWIGRGARCGCGGLCDSGGPCPMSFNWRAPFQWVISGGESGPRARPCNYLWIQSLVGQCRSAGVSSFVKQLGDCAVTCESEAAWSVGRHHSLGLVADKGGNMDEWPSDVRVREFPR